MAAALGQLSRLTKLQWTIQWTGEADEDCGPMTGHQMQLMLGPMAPSLRELLMASDIEALPHDRVPSASATAMRACTQLTMLRLFSPLSRGVFPVQISIGCKCLAYSKMRASQHSFCANPCRSTEWFWWHSRSFNFSILHVRLTSQHTYRNYQLIRHRAAFRFETSMLHGRSGLECTLACADLHLYSCRLCQTRVL